LVRVVEGDGEGVGEGMEVVGEGVEGLVRGLEEIESLETADALL